MSTRVYGTSDDLIEIEGDVYGEENFYGDEEGPGMLLFFSDATVLECKYSGRVGGVWEIKAIRKGSLFEDIELCDDEEAELYSDVVTFKDGLKWGYAAKEWNRIQ